MNYVFLAEWIGTLVLRREVAGGAECVHDSSESLAENLNLTVFGFYCNNCHSSWI